MQRARKEKVSTGVVCQDLSLILPEPVAVYASSEDKVVGGSKQKMIKAEEREVPRYLRCKIISSFDSASFLTCG